MSQEAIWTPYGAFWTALDGILFSDSRGLVKPPPPDS